MKVTGKIKAWSYSRWRTYASCPLKAGLLYVMRLKEPGNAAMERGSKIHEIAAKYLGNHAARAPRMPKELKPMAEKYKALRKLKPTVEEKWGFDRKWNPCGFFDWNFCVARVVIDAFTIDQDTGHAVVIDHKTGKLRPADIEQLELYALAMFKKFPEVKSVETQLWYIDFDAVRPEEKTIFTRSKDEKRLEKKWATRVKPIFADRTYIPNPGRHCMWCHFRKENGGPCKF